MKTLEDLRAELARRTPPGTPKGRQPVTTAEEIRERLADREAEAERRIEHVLHRYAPKARANARQPGLVRLTQPCVSRILHTYLRAGSIGRVVNRANGKLWILFGGTLAVIAEDSPLIEAVK